MKKYLISARYVKATNTQHCHLWQEWYPQGDSYKQLYVAKSAGENDAAIA